MQNTGRVMNKLICKEHYKSYLKGNQQFKSLAYSIKALETVTDKVILSDEKTGKTQPK